MRVLDLFSGIGGFSLGLERAGFTTVAFCECEPYARAVLGKHWPGIPCYPDVTALTADRLAADGIRAELICGGFPCQDISIAGKGAGLAGERSGLWREFYRLIGELGPRYIIVENVSALLNRGVDVVLGDLAEIGYDAEWHCIPASYVGAPHRRDRIWIVAYPHGDRAVGGRGHRTGQDIERDAKTPLQERQDLEPGAECSSEADVGGWWALEPSLGRMAHGVPRRVDRLRCLGNSVVPQVVEVIGRAIMKAESLT